MKPEAIGGAEAPAAAGTCRSVLTLQQCVTATLFQLLAVAEERRHLGLRGSGPVCHCGEEFGTISVWFAFAFTAAVIIALHVKLL